MSTNLDHNIIDTPKARTGWIVTGLFLFAAMVIIISVLMHEYSLSVYEQELAAQMASSLPQELLDLRANEEFLLGTSEVIDSATSACRIPVERAMELMVQEASQ